MHRGGGGAQTRDEHCIDTHQVTVFFAHFISFPSENLENLRKLYIEKQLSVVEISKFTDWPCSTIKNAIQKFKLSRERDSKHEKFGWKKVNGQLIEHKGELKTIHVVIEMRENGSSFPEIAKYLNSKNMKTKLKKSWTKVSVREVYIKNVKKD